MGSECVENAIELAVRAHRGQVDKSGAPYILHPLRLMVQFDDPTRQAVAVLHDVIEDSELTRENLLAAGIPENVVVEVECLTRGEGESYADFIERIKARPIAAAVKLADLRDNLRVERLPSVGERDVARLNKYLEAVARLTKEG